MIAKCLACYSLSYVCHFALAESKGEAPFGHKFAGSLCSPPLFRLFTKIELLEVAQLSLQSLTAIVASFQLEENKLINY